ncbi:hypothetical protein KUU17_30825, partial [Pseudomonas aeruginosa]|nr:hypothetical protein [Pseudomonas aeruginosa]
SKRSFTEVLDSEFERCRMRLPLIGRWFEGRRKRLSRKENFRKKRLTEREVAVECAASVETKALTNCSLTSRIKQFVWVLVM